MALSPARKRIYAFMDLPYHVKLERALSLGLVQDSDWGGPIGTAAEQDVMVTWIKRAKSKGVLDQLLPEVKE